MSSAYCAVFVFCDTLKLLCVFSYYVLLYYYYYYYYYAAVSEYVPSENDAMDNAVMQQWTRNRVFIPTLSTIATRHRNQHRLVDRLHRMFHRL